MKRKLTILSAAALALMLMFTACAKTEGTHSGTASYSPENITMSEGATEPTTEMILTDKEIKMLKPVNDLVQLQDPKLGETVATLHTNKGDIYVRFFPQYAPKAVENFVKHAKDGYYNGVIFHRVIKDFMIQGGDPEGTGTGGESIWGEPFEMELSFNLRHFRGALCMARSNDPVSQGSQFYIVQNPELDDDLKSELTQMKSMKDKIWFKHSQIGELTYGDIYPDEVIDEYVNNGGYPSLDTNYTVFGQVYSGMDVVDAIANVPTNGSDKPDEDVIIESIEVSECTEDDIALAEAEKEESGRKADTEKSETAEETKADETAAN